MINRIKNTNTLVFTLFLFLQNAEGGVIQDPVPVSSGIEAISTSDPRAQVFGDPNYKEGGHGMYYRKGNQNITLQIDYVSRKIDFLRDPTNEPRKKFELLGGFCGAKPQIIDKKSLQSCIDDYVQVMKFWELKALGSIGKNNDAQVRLQCLDFDSSGVCVSSSEGKHFLLPESSKESAKREQAPAFATAKQLATFAESSPLSRVSDTGNVEWEKRMFEALAPSEEDFNQFQKVAMNGAVLDVSQRLATPKHGDSPALKRLDFDREELESAKLEWEKLKNRLQKKFPKGEPLPSVAEVRRKFIEDFKQDVSPENRSVGRYLYDQARGENVDYTNESYNQTRSSSINSSTAGSNSDDLKSLKNNSGISAASRVRGGADGSESKKFPNVKEVTLTISGPSGPHGYLGNERVIMPNAAVGSQPMGENSVTYNPAARPRFKALSGPDPVQAAHGVGSATDSTESSEAVNPENL